MARKIRDSNLETRAARNRLPVAADHKPLYRTIEPGLHLGYRKLAADKPGTWCVRRWLDGKYSVINLRATNGNLAIADDYADADGDNVLSFAQAQKAATGPRQTISKGGFTVAEAVALYKAYLKADHRSPSAIANAEYVIGKHILGRDIANARVAGLTKERLVSWRDGIVAQARDDPEKRRARMVTANRTLTTLQAILNFAVKEKKCEAGAWSDVGKYKRVERARERYLEIEEAQRLVQHCDDNLRPLVQAALQTGCRYSELAALEARDLDLRAGTIKIRTSKNGHARNVLLSDGGTALFRAISNGRSGSEKLFTRANGEPWGHNFHTRPFRAACESAGLGDDVLFHTLRHTWASQAVMAGMPLLLVAQNLGHMSRGRPHTAMVEQTYGHMSESYTANAMRNHAPRFGGVAPKLVAVA